MTKILILNVTGNTDEWPLMLSTIVDAERPCDVEQIDVDALTEDELVVLVKEVSVISPDKIFGLINETNIESANMIRECREIPMTLMVTAF